MNPNRKKDFESIVQAVAYSENKMKPHRESRAELISLMVGVGYGEKNIEVKTRYINLLNLATIIYMRQLVVRAPTAKITTPYEKLRPLAANLELACEDAAKEVKLGLVLRRAALEALYSPMAVVKVGLEYAGEGNFLGSKVDLTNTFVRNVSFDDYFRDMTMRSAYDPYFEGDTYVLTQEEFKARYPKETIDDADKGINSSAAKRAEDLSHGPTGGDEGLAAKITLRDVWLPNERVLITFKANNPGDHALSVIEDFDTEEEGPYHKLWFNGVPDNAMPLPPYAAVKDLHILANSLMTRLAYQANNKKAVVGFDNEEDANNFGKTRDGHGMFYKGQDPRNLTAGGIDPTIEALFLQVKDMFSWSVGNLDLMGGLSPMSETLGQDKMLAQQAGAQLADMQDAVNEFAKGIYRKIAFDEWTDPIRERYLSKGIPGTDIYISIPWNPDTRQGDFLDMNFNIVPQSMREEIPGAQMNKIYSVINNVYIPLMQTFNQQGLTLDVRRLNHFIADYTNIPEISDIIIPMSQEMIDRVNQPQGNQNPGVSKPAVTERTYKRVNMPGATRGGKEMALQNLLWGGDVQPDEKAAITRNVS